MSTSWIIKLNFMVMGLLLVVYLMYGLDKRGLGPNISTFFGVEPQRTVQSLKDQGQISICNGEIRALERPGQFKMFQKGYKWLATNLNIGELDFITVEKWFGQNCILNVKFEKPQSYDESGFKPSLVVQFLQGQDLEIFENPEGVYMWKGKPFRSAQLQKAIKNLENLAGSEPQKQ